MAWLLVSIPTATMLASTIHSIEQSNQAKRKAGQDKNSLLAAEATAKRDFEEREKMERATSERDSVRKNQRRRMAMMGGPRIAPQPTLLGEAPSPLTAAANTLIGS